MSCWELAGTTGLEPATSDVTVKVHNRVFSFVSITYGIPRDQPRVQFGHESRRFSGRMDPCLCQDIRFRLMALGVWIPWKHIFNVSLLHVAFKSEVRRILKTPYRSKENSRDRRAGGHARCARLGHVDARGSQEKQQPGEKRKRTHVESKTAHLATPYLASTNAWETVKAARVLDEERKGRSGNDQDGAIAQ